jgi:hypothetical protein
VLEYLFSPPLFTAYFSPSYRSFTLLQVSVAESAYSATFSISRGGGRGANSNASPRSNRYLMKLGMNSHKNRYRFGGGGFTAKSGRSPGRNVSNNLTSIEDELIVFIDTGSPEGIKLSGAQVSS